MVPLQGEQTPPDRPSVRERLRGVLISGAAITIPLLITIVVLSFVVNFILRTIGPLVTVVEQTFGVGRNLTELELEIVGIVTLIVLVFVIGIVAEARSGSGLEQAFDTAMAHIPGVGSVYTSFNEMSELLLSNDTQSFREVKLVEFPSEGMYTIAFVTADTPSEFQDAAGHEGMTTLFMPMAPNPVMGGFVMHVSTDRVHDVDITVEEGIRSIVTSGVATGSTDDVPGEGELVDLGKIRRQARDGVEDIGNWGARTADDISDLSAMTVDELEALDEQTRREIVSVHPDVDLEDTEEDVPSRHYTLSQSTESDDRSTSSTAGDVDDSSDEGLVDDSSGRDDEGEEGEEGVDDEDGGRS